MTAALKNLACIVNYFLKIFRPKFQHNTIFACGTRVRYAVMRFVRMQEETELS